ncbi:Protocadherin Fat 4-like [Oopsacas minuta]|uniref:Protocadherin Fat 4-like n=1 Tax=Oopsacas minuta TaxID=111878 RepID=A0AAV7KD90_9METZ|nr:Protocadherin Fat 4-like [Oopsacas minuta]
MRITLLSALDSELYRDCIIFQVQANDLAAAEYRKYSLANVILIVLDVNDDSPYFLHTHYSILIPFDLDYGDVIYLSAVDRDIVINSELTYSLSGDICYFYTHIMDGGVFYNGQILQVNQEYHLVLTGTDHAPLGLIDIREDLGVAELVYQLETVDFDIGDSGIIEYYISTGNTHEVFDISNDGALLYRTRYHPASDLGGNFVIASFEIRIIPRNMHAPEFSEQIYYFEHLHVVDIGGVIGRISATDVDTGNEGSISYSLISHSSDVFVLNHITGVIHLFRSADYTNYTILAQACDNAVSTYKLCTNTTNRR